MGCAMMVPRRLMRWKCAVTWRFRYWLFMFEHASVRLSQKITLIAGGSTPFVLLTVPAGIILCTAGVVFGPKLIGA